MNDELLLLIPTLLLGLTMALEIVWVWSARGTVEGSIKNLDNRIERLKEMEYKLPKFQVGDVVTVRKEAEKYGITVLPYELIVSDILVNGMIKVYVPLSNGRRSAEIVYNPEWLELVRRQGLDNPGTEKLESVKPKFEVGDIVIGNEKAKDYAITTTGFLGTVIEIEGDDLMVIKGIKYPNLTYTVKQECFDLFGEQQKTEKPKFKVGDVVVGNKKAEEYGIPVPRCKLVVSEIMNHGCVRVCTLSGDKVRSNGTVFDTFNTEWLDLVQQQTVDIPETEKPESIMERWANESENFSKAIKNLLKEFGFGSTYQIKYQIRSAFSEKYIKLFDKLGTNSSDPDDISVIQLAKALLVVSAYLETDNIEEIIDWADSNMDI